MNFLKRELAYSLLTISPFLVLFLSMALFGFIAVKVLPEDTESEAVIKALSAHFHGKDKTTIDAFDSSIYLVKTNITKGEVIRRDELKRSSVDGNAHLPGLKNWEGPLAGRLVKSNLEAGQFLKASDLGDLSEDHSKDHWSDPWFLPIVIALGSSVLAAVVLFAIGYFWILRQAFTKNILGGLGCVFFAWVCIPRFVTLNWSEARMPCQLMLASIFIIGTTTGFCMPGKLEVMRTTQACGGMGFDTSKYGIKKSVVYTD